MHKLNETMVPQRRRRRRIVQQAGSSAWRVLVSRGSQGFGFTIAGQAPCVVSHVATGGPADRAGLRAGLALLAVDGATISRAPHEVVARLIAAAPQAIALTVTADRDREPSDTSDDERVRPRPRHPQRPRPKPQRMEIRQLRSEPPRRRPDVDCSVSHAPSLVSAVHKNQYKCHIPIQDSVSECCLIPHYHGCNPGSSKLHTERLQQNPIIRNQLECIAVVGYLGTIETPTPISKGSEVQTVRTSIRKLRQEKRSSTLVLMTVLPATMNLKKSNGTLLAEYSNGRIIYVSCSSENDYRYFGLVTGTSHPASNDNDVEMSHSCHVFIVDPKLTDHSTHLSKANEFCITCTLDPVTNHCLEFPASAEYVVGVIRSMYSLHTYNGISSPGIENISRLAVKNNSPAVANFSRNNNRQAPLRGVRHGHRVNGCAVDHRNNLPLNAVDNFRQDAQGSVSNSPQPSNHSEMTTTSSNSDSGIGFHNDNQNVADRILVVDFEQQPRPQVNGYGLNHKFDAHLPVNVVKQRPLGIVGSNYDMDSSFLSNTMPVVDGFGGCGQPLNHLDDIVLRPCDIQQPHCSFSNNVTNPSYNSKRNGESNNGNAKDTYNYNNVHYGNIASCSKTGIQNCKSTCIDSAKDLCPDYDTVYTETEGHLYEMIKPQIDIDIIPDIDHVNEKFKAVDIYQETHRSIYNERRAENAQHETESIDNMTITSSKSHDYMHSGKTSMDDISMFSSRSQEYFSPNAKHMKKLQASVDDILMLGLGKSASANNYVTDDDKNFVHPANVKFKIRKSMKPMNFLARTKNIFQKDEKKCLKSPVKKERTRALSASVNDVCGHDNVSELIPTASSEPDLRDSSSHNSESEQSSPFRRWTTGGGTGSSYRHHDQRTMYSKQVAESSSAGCKEGGVARWSLGLEQLLSDPSGAAAFAAFLAKEFAAENIKFWWSCEQYRSLPEADRPSAAREVWSRHLADGAPEPVNVDAPARRATALGLDAAPADLFHQPQKQIFNLMKFDSYPRFLRSGVHAECARADLRGERPPYTLPDLTPATPSKLKKSASNASERRRSGGSLIPWSRLRAVSRDREQHDEKPTHTDVVQTSNGSCSLCRVVLPDGATSVVGVEACVTVRRLVDRLLTRRALNESCRAYDVLLVPGPDQQAVCVELDSASTVLGGKSARVERRCVFRLELPGRRAVAVRCRPGKRLRHVLRPVLARYLPNSPAAPALRRDGVMVPLDTRVQDIDGNRLQVVFEGDDSCGRAPPDGDTCENECDAEGEDDLALRLQEESPRSVDGDSTNASMVRAALRPGPPVHAHPHPPDFLENLRQTQRARLQTKPIASPRVTPPPLPPKPRQKHINTTTAAGALV